MAAVHGSEPQAKATALIVDDDLDMGRVLEIALAAAGCAAIAVDSAARAIDIMAKHRFPFAFIDARLPDMDGLLLIEELRRSNPGTRVFLISGYYTEDDVRIVEALRGSRIYGFFAKPFQVEAILAVVRAMS